MKFFRRFSYERIEIKMDYEQTKSIYLNRTFGGDCHYRIVDGDIDAGTAAGEKAGKDCCLQIQPESVWAGGEDVLRR